MLYQVQINVNHELIYKIIIISGKKTQSYCVQIYKTPRDMTISHVGIIAIITIVNLTEANNCTHVTCEIRKDSSSLIFNR